jgi:HEAT repeat protein
MGKRWLVLGLVVVVAGLLIVGVVAVVRRPHARWVARLGDENPAVRAAAIRAMAEEGNEKLIIGMLEDEDADVRLVAVMELVREYHEKDERDKKYDGRGTARAYALVPLLGDEHLGVRREVMRALRLLGPDARPALHSKR